LRLIIIPLDAVSQIPFNEFSFGEVDGADSSEQSSLPDVGYYQRMFCTFIT
jgi:hypothetical protein